MTPAQLTDLIRKLQREGKIPTTLSPKQIDALARSVARYGEYIGDDGVKKVLEKLKSGIEDVMNPQLSTPSGTTLGPTQGSLRSGISQLINQFSTVEGLGNSINLDFIINTATAIMGGSGRYIADTTPEQVALYPAWALSRFADRDTPRGFKRGKGDALVPVPDDDWPSRWADAGEDAGDDDWLDWEGDAQTGRGVALKSSGIWEALGNVRDDSLGNPYPPFAFNSGFKVGPVSRAEAIKLGLIDPSDEVDPPVFDLAKLIKLPEAA